MYGGSKGEKTQTKTKQTVGVKNRFIKKRQKRNVSAGVNWKKLIKINLALRFAV